MFAVIAGASACSTSPYTTAKAIGDLQEESELTRAQAKCVVTAIRKHFAGLITARQKEINGSPLPADRLRLEVNSALATIREPRASEQNAARRAIAECAPSALR